MSGVETKRADSSLPIRESYILESRIAASFSGQVFKAVDKRTRISVALWVSREPLSDIGTDQFLRRVEALLNASVGPEILSFGLDCEGLGWVAFKLLSGRHILEGKVENQEAERRWLACVRVIERLHAAGVRCGDICLDSFVLTLGGDVRFIGGIGLLSSPAEVKALRERPELQEFGMYLAPEQVEGRGETTQSDVFALCVLGARFMCGRGISEINPSFGAGGQYSLPELAEQHGWFEMFIAPILASSPNQRPRDASAFLHHVIKHRSETRNESGSSASSFRREKILTGDDIRSTSRGASLSGGNVGGIGRRKRRIVAILIGAVFLGAFISVSSSFIKETVGGAPVEAADPSAVSSKIEVLALSDDPLAHESLVRLLKDRHEGPERTAVVNAILSRGRRLGFLRATDLIRGWYNAGEAPLLLGGDSPIALKVINQNIDDAARVALLEKSYPESRAQSLQLAAALGLDRGNLDPYRTLFVQGTKDLASVSDASERSTGAVVLAIPAVRAVFLSDVLEEPSSIPKNDTPWLLQKMGDQGDAQVRSIAALGLKNGSFVGPTRVFAEGLVNGVGLSLRERSALVACLRGEVSRGVVATLVASYGTKTPQALLAIILMSKDPEVVQAALQGLSTKPLSDAYLRSVLDFINNHPGPDPESYARLLATVGMSDYLDESQFNSGLAVISTEPLNRDLVSVLLHKGPPRVVFEVLRLTGPKLQAGVYLDLLRHPSSEVRIEALHRLEGVNDASAIAYIKQFYADEQDETVRQAYRTLLGVPH